MNRNKIISIYFLIIYFIFTGISAHADKPQVVAIRSIHSNKLVSSGWGNNDLLAATSKGNSARRTFILVYLQDGNVALLSAYNGKYVRAGLGKDSLLGAVSSHISSWEKFKLIRLKNDIFALKSAHNNKYVRAGAYKQSYLAAASTRIDAWEKFRIREHIWKKKDNNQKTYNIKMHAVLLSDDDGKRRVPITTNQINMWVDKANEGFKRSNAGINIVFDASAGSDDWERVKNTKLNNLDSGDPDGWDDGNKFAAKYPGKMVVYFRYGKGKKETDSTTANGFAFFPKEAYPDRGNQTNFIAMPGDFNATSVIVGGTGPDGWKWEQGIKQLLHDIGHYLGLPHTFPGSHDQNTDTPAKASNYINHHDKYPGLAMALDGDGIAHTPPEAGQSFYRKQNWNPCGSKNIYTINTDNGLLSFFPLRNNPMSYFSCEPFRFTKGQVDKMTNTLHHKDRIHLIN